MINEMGENTDRITISEALVGVAGIIATCGIIAGIVYAARFLASL